MYSGLSPAMPEETSFCFQIFITNLSHLSEQLDKQILFYCNGGEYAGTKQQVSISAAPALGGGIVGTEFVMSKVLVLTFRMEKYLVNMHLLARQEEV